MIAMALACDPRLIIADEPTTALDVMIQAQILRLIEQLVARPGHRPDHDQPRPGGPRRHLRPARGDVRGPGGRGGPGPAGVRGRPAPVRRALSAAFPRIGDPASRFAPRGLAGDPPDPAALPSGCTFHPRCPVALESAPRRTRRCARRGRSGRAACVLVGPSGTGARAARSRRRTEPRPGRLRRHRDDRAGTGARASEPEPAMTLSPTATEVTTAPCSAPRASTSLPRPARRPAGPRGGRGRPRHPPRRDRRAGRRVRLRQDDPGPHACSAWSADRGPGHLRRRARSTYSGRALKAYRKRVQLVLQDPSGSLNPRHTVYDAVAEGLRIHGYARRRAGRRSPMPCPGPACARRSASSCATRTNCPAGSASGSSSPARSSWNPNSSSPTSRWRPSTRRYAARSSPCCCGCAPNWACQRWSSRTTWAWRGTSPTGSR